MEKNYDHITKMENIMVNHEKTIKALEKILEELDAQQKDYEELNTYYYSEQRFQDLEDEENHKIPETIKRGVLSEDGLYNLFMDTNDAALHMMEAALRLLKTK